MFVVWSGKKVFALLLVLIVAQLALCGVLLASRLPARKATLIDFTVVLDAGHGGIDGGVVGADGVKESDLNLQYVKTLRDIFERAGFNVVLTRSTDGGLYGLPTKGFKSRDMLQRKKIIDETRPNLVLSVHMNKFSRSYRSGPQVFFQQGKADGQLLAESVQRALNDFSGSSTQALCGDYFVCRETSCPAAIVECGFLSNAEECAALQRDEYREQLCNVIFNGTMLYLYAG